MRYPKELVHKYGAKAGILMYVRDHLPDIPQVDFVVKTPDEPVEDALNRADKNSAKSASYITYSSFDSGPNEFQTAETALKHGTRLYYSISEIVDGVQYVMQNAPVLKGRIEDFVAVVMDGKQGNAEKLKNEVIGISKAMYDKNIKGGFKFDYNTRYWLVFLCGFLGLAAGLGAGALADNLGDRYGWYEKRKGIADNFRRTLNDYYVVGRM